MINIRSMILAAPIVFLPAAYADIGSKHQDMHKSKGEKRQSRQKNTAQPFDFLAIADSLMALEKGAVETHLGAHVDQYSLEMLPAYDAFIEAFEEGDELFEINYNALDGAGVNVGNGQRFSTLPRLDLTGENAWASVKPNRITGPNSDSCISCHNQTVPDGPGGVNDNVIRIDPERRQKGFIERQTPHILGMGAVQLVAEEMTTELHALRDAAIDQSCLSGSAVELSLSTNTVDFGTISVSCDDIDYSELEGLDEDLVVKPFEWKGLTAFVRDFVRGASHQELGMQATELVGDFDSDFDGVSNELSVGDITALAVYNAAQPRPTSKLELNTVVEHLTDEEQEKYGLPLASAQIQSIENGENAFIEMQCGTCHVPSIQIANTVFSEPSLHSDYRDQVFPVGESVAMPSIAIQFDITSEVPDNEVVLASGQSLGQFERASNGEAIVRMYGDLKRHDMGKALAESIDEGNVGASVFLTENLWGVGSSAPYLHDGRATTLAEAIVYHGGDASASRDLFLAASTQEQIDVIQFLDNLVLYIAGE